MFRTKVFNQGIQKVAFSPGRPTRIFGLFMGSGESLQIFWIDNNSSLHTKVMTYSYQRTVVGAATPLSFHVIDNYTVSWIDSSNLVLAWPSDVISKRRILQNTIKGTENHASHYLVGSVIYIATLNYQTTKMLLR